MKVLLFGAAGYLGTYFLKLYPDAITPKVDIADANAVVELLDAESPDVVINAAGKTGRPNVDWCEDHQEETYAANVTGPKILNDECKKRGIYFVHIGSGCIYEGDSSTPFTEEDPPNFFGSFYARSKAYIDQILLDFPVLILRLRMPFDGVDSERSLISKIKKYDRVLDVENSLTYLPDFLEAAEKLIEKRATGAYNVVNPGTISPYGIMELYKEIVDPSHTFERLTEDQLSEVAKAGRSNCVLSTAKLEGEGIAMRPIEEVGREALAQLSP